MVVATILGCVGGYRGGGFFGLLLWIFLFCGCGLILIGCVGLILVGCGYGG